MTQRNPSERLTIAAEQNIKERAFWLGQLSGELVKSHFPYDHKKTGQKKPVMDSINFVFPGECQAKLMRLSKGSNYTLNLIFTAGLILLLEKYTGRNDIMVGMPIYKQEMEGEFINTVLVLREVIEPHLTFQEFLLRVRQTIKNAVENQNYPIEILAKELNLEDQEGDFPLIDVAILLENIHPGEYLQHLGCSLVFVMHRTDESIEGAVEYNSLLYEKNTIERIIAHFINVFQKALFDVNIQTSALEIFTREEKRQLLFDFNRTTAEYPGDKTIHQWFEEQVEKTPDKPAVCSPLDLNDIYDLLESERVKVTPVLKEKMESCCFKRNAFIYQTNLHRSGKRGNLKILKTHRHNSVIVNNNMVKCLDLFDGKRNLKSIYSLLEETKNSEFLIYSMSRNDLLEVTFQFNDEPEVFSIDSGGFEEFIKFLKVLYKNHLIQLAGIQAGEVVIEVSPGKGFESSAGDALPLPQARPLIESKKLEKAQVLLLGDTPGTASTGIVYLAAYLMRHGIKSYCQFYDPSRDHTGMKQNIEKLLDAVLPAVVAISMKWFLYIARVIEMGKIIKEYSRKNHREIKIVLGGNTASYYTQEMIKYDWLEVLVRGDGEEPLLKICQGQDIATIPNCVYKKNGQILENPMTYVQQETDSPGIYLSHLEDILISNDAARLGTFFIYTHKGCAMNCLYCGGCRSAQQKAFNRPKVLRRGVEEVRKDIIAAQTYASTFHFEFDIPDTVENLLDYCKKIWTGIDLTGHFCIFSTLAPPSAALIDLVSQTFKYVYWDLDICTPSQRHRQQLASMGLVKPQLSDREILEFMARCEKYSNIEVRPNLITGLPYFTFEDIEPAEALLEKIMACSCFGELHWARLHAQPGAPILETADTHQMYSFAAAFADFLQYSQQNFNSTAGYSTVETFNYPYIYFKDDRLNSLVTNFYMKTNRKVDQTITDREKALIIGDTLTYRELNQAVDELCAVLKARGAAPGQILALLVARSNDIPIGILGILKAGCAYMPIDPEFPGGRIEYMLKDSGAKTLVTTRSLAEQDEKVRRWEGETILMDSLEPAFCPGRGEVSSPAPADQLATSLAYTIYTSGTTGKPKGVLLTHDSLVNYVHWFSAAANLTQEDKTILTSSIAFDLGYTSLFTSILKGCELHILTKEMYLLAERLLDYIRQKEITYLKLTPSLFSILVNSPAFTQEKCRSLRLAAVGGEPIDVEDIETAHSICNHIRIMNHYGPTEATIGCVAALIDFDKFAAFKDTPVIGKPIYNTRVYILDKTLELLPVGVPGELSISGTCLARGYLNRPELTTEKFCPPFYRSYKSYMTYILPKVYRTGDLARWLPDGTIEFLGRIDTQVKVRGYRIELGEIENRLRKHPQIQDALVLVKELSTPDKNIDQKEKEKYLCAYIVPKGAKTQALKNTENREHIVQNGNEPGILTVKQFQQEYLEYQEPGPGEPHRSLVHYFEQQVKKKPNQPAVKSNGDCFTYEALNDFANRAARKILEEYQDRYKLSKQERVRYQRQMLLHGWGMASQEKLKSTTVFVAGAGGGASPTIMQLALTGFGTIIVCDCDVVELSNLNRQFLHDEKRIGMNKALSAKITIERINPHVTVIPVTQRLTRDNVLALVGNSAVIFDMFDGMEDKFILSECAARKGIPHIISAMTDINAYAAVFHPPKTPCYHCIFDREKLKEVIEGMKQYTDKYEKNPLAVAPSSLFMSTGFAVNEGIKIVLGFENPAYNRFMFFNQRGTGALADTQGYKAMTYNFSEHFLRLCRDQGFDWDIGWRGNFLEELEIHPDPLCPLCGKNAKLKQEIPHSTTIDINFHRTGGEDEPKPQQTVALWLDHNLTLSAGMMAALKSAKTYVLIEPDAPAENLHHILEDSEARVILTDNHHIRLATKTRDKVNKNLKIINLDTHSGCNQDQEPPVNQPGPGCQNLNIEMDPQQIFFMSYSPSQQHWQVDFWKAMLNGTGDYILANPGKEVTLHSLAEELRKYLLEELPDYMIPSHFIPLGKIPLTPNGKLDRKALPEPVLGSPDQLAAPRDEVEGKLLEIWSNVLEIEKDKIGIDSNFFQLGGHSLKATIMIAQLHRELNVKFPLAQLFQAPTIRGTAEIIRGLTRDTYISIKPVEKRTYYPVSSAQKRLYILYQLDETSTRYNMPVVMRLEGTVDEDRVKYTFKQMVQRHESLRTSFKMKGNEPQQRIHEASEVQFELQFTDLSADNDPDRHRGNEAEAVGNFLGCFNLAQPPLFRAGLVKTIEKKYILMVDLHHIIADGTSINILQQEFRALYASEELPPIKLQYKEFSQWQNQLLASGIMKKQEMYWLNRFRGNIPVLNMPLDYPRTGNYTASGNRVSFRCEKEITTQIKQLVQETGATLFMVLLAVYSILLALYTRQEDIVVGTPVAGRRHADLHNIIGLFANMLALRNQPKKEKNFRQFLEEVKTNALDAYENQEYQFEQLVWNLKIKTEGVRNPLFDAVIVLQNTQAQKISIGNLETLSKIRVLPFEIGIEKVHHELLLTAEDAGETLEMSLEYSTELYKESTAREITRHYMEILKQIIDHRDIKLKDIAISHDLMKAGTGIIPDEQDDFDF